MNHSIEGVGHVWAGERFLTEVEYIVDLEASIGTLIVADGLPQLNEDSENLLLYMNNEQSTRFIIANMCVVQPQTFYRIQLEPNSPTLK